MIIIIPTILLLAWVVLHIVMVDDIPESFYHELKSTWVRGLIGLMLGLFTGFIFPRVDQIFWRRIVIGSLFIGFIIVDYSYVVHVVFNKLTALDIDNNIFYGKVSAVYSGSIILALILTDNSKKNIIIKVMYITMILMILFTYIHVLNTKNGILLYSCVSLLFLLVYFREKYKFSIDLKFSSILFLILLIGFFAQYNKNKGWSTFWENIVTAQNITSYNHWQNPASLGYPDSATESNLDRSTYERVAWAKVGVIKALEHPVGVGTLTAPLAKRSSEDLPTLHVPSTHSGLIDFALSFGSIGLFLLLLPFLVMASITFLPRNRLRFTTFNMLLLTIFFAYLFCELNTQHSIEILLFWVGFLESIFIIKIYSNEI
jgi:hypothetical protein